MRSNLYGLTGLTKSFGAYLTPGYFNVPGTTYNEPVATGLIGGGIAGGRLCGSKLLERYLGHYENILKRHNKSIDAKDLESLKNKIQTMGQIEEELSKSLKFIETYARLLSRYGDGSAETLKLSNLEEMVTAQRNLHKRYISEEQAIIGVFTELQKLNRKLDYLN